MHTLFFKFLTVKISVCLFLIPFLPDTCIYNYNNDQKKKTYGETVSTMYIRTLNMKDLMFR